MLHEGRTQALIEATRDVEIERKHAASRVFEHRAREHWRAAMQAQPQVLVKSQIFPAAVEKDEAQLPAINWNEFSDPSAARRLEALVLAELARRIPAQGARGGELSLRAASVAPRPLHEFREA